MPHKRAVLSYTFLLNLVRSDTMRRISSFETPRLSKICSNEWNKIVFGTFKYSKIPREVFAQKPVES